MSERGSFGSTATINRGPSIGSKGGGERTFSPVSTGPRVSIGLRSERIGSVGNSSVRLNLPGGLEPKPLGVNLGLGERSSAPSIAKVSRTEGLQSRTNTTQGPRFEAFQPLAPTQERTGRVPLGALLDSIPFRLPEGQMQAPRSIAGSLDNVTPARRLPSTRALGNIGHLIDQEGGTTGRVDVSGLLSQPDPVLIPRGQDGGPLVRANQVRILPDISSRRLQGKNSQPARTVSREPINITDKPGIKPTRIAQQEVARTGQTNRVERNTVTTNETPVQSARVSESKKDVPSAQRKREIVEELRQITGIAGISRLAHTVKSDSASNEQPVKYRSNINQSKFSWIRGFTNAAIPIAALIELDERRRKMARKAVQPVHTDKKDTIDSILIKPSGDLTTIVIQNAQSVNIPVEEQVRLAQLIKLSELVPQAKQVGTAVDAQIVRQTGKNTAPALSPSVQPANSESAESKPNLQAPPSSIEHSNVQTGTNEQDQDSSKYSSFRFIVDERARRARLQLGESAASYVATDSNGEVDGLSVAQIVFEQSSEEILSQIAQELNADGSFDELLAEVAIVPAMPKSKIGKVFKEIERRKPPVAIAKMGKMVTKTDVDRVLYGRKKKEALAV